MHLPFQLSSDTRSQKVTRQFHHHGSGLPSKARTEDFWGTKFQRGVVLTDLPSNMKILRKTLRSIKHVGPFIPPAAGTWVWLQMVTNR